MNHAVDQQRAATQAVTYDRNLSRATLLLIPATYSSDALSGLSKDAAEPTWARIWVRNGFLSGHLRDRGETALVAITSLPSGAPTGAINFSALFSEGSGG